MKYFLLTSLALIAFAGNSILGRLALNDNAIDPLSFTWLRLISGSIVLITLFSLQKKQTTQSLSKPSWNASFMLLAYAVLFSYAYVILEAGTGTLILFAAVQATIIIAGLLSGERFKLMEAIGSILAFTGFIYLVFPKLNTPNFKGFLAMTSSGVAWGLYTLEGKKSQDPLKDSAYNFTRTLPFITLIGLLYLSKVQATRYGITLAITSGAITSGLGYTIWFTALKGLSIIQAAVLQLLVPVLATIGGILFIDENLHISLIISSLLILGGILLITLSKNKKTY